MNTQVLIDLDADLYLSKIKDGYGNLITQEYWSPGLDALFELGFIHWKEVVSYRHVKENKIVLTREGEAFLFDLDTKKVWVTYSEYPEITSASSPTDEWSMDDVNMNGSYDNFYLEDPGNAYHDTATIPKTMTGKCYLVWCTYAEGCTFGQTTGKFAFEGIAKTEVGAKLLEKLAYHRHDDYFGGLEHTHVETIEL